MITMDEGKTKEWSCLLIALGFSTKRRRRRKKKEERQKKKKKEAEGRRKKEEGRRSSHSNFDMASIVIGKRQRWHKLCADDGPDKRLKNEDTTHLLQNHNHNPDPNPNPNPNPSAKSKANRKTKTSHETRPYLSRVPDPSPPRDPPRLVRRPEEWETDMISYLAASRLCREEAMACSLLSDQVPLDLSLVSKKKNKKNKMMTKRKLSIPSCPCPSSSSSSSSTRLSSSSSSKALNLSRSWGGNLKKILCKQFMPFSTSNSVSRILQARNNVSGLHEKSSLFCCYNNSNITIMTKKGCKWLVSYRVAEMI